VAQGQAGCRREYREVPTQLGLGIGAKHLAGSAPLYGRFDTANLAAGREAYLSWVVHPHARRSSEIDIGPAVIGRTGDQVTGAPAAIHLIQSPGVHQSAPARPPINPDNRRLPVIDGLVRGRLANSKDALFPAILGQLNSWLLANQQATAGSEVASMKKERQP
jgi:hypothetical protein